MAGLLKDDAPETWFDHAGVEMRTPTISGRLKFKYPLHAALRAFVFIRDGFCCQVCGVNVTAPTNYSGRFSPGLPGEPILVMDHVISRRNGGAHHPDNLVVLCDPCNARKAATIDRLGVQSA